VNRSIYYRIINDMTKNTFLHVLKKYSLLGFLSISALGLGSIVSLLTLRSGMFEVLGSMDENLTMPQKIAREILDKCEVIGERCYSNEFAKLAKVEDLDTSLTILDEVNKIDPQTRGCHLIAHSISTEETLKGVDKWQEVLEKVPADRCTGGFLHGIFEARQSKDPTIEINEQTIPELCEIVQEKAQGGNDQECSHIMGHLLVVVKDGDLGEAAAVCDRLPQNLQYECHSGVFMENETRDGIVQHGLGTYIPWNKETTQEQQDICESYDGIAAKGCWREISHMFTFIAKDYPPEMFRLCAQAEDVENVTDCYLHGVGVTVVSSNFDVKNMEVLCAPFSRYDMFAKCVDMAIGSMMTSSIEFASGVKALCSQIPNNFKEGCYERLGQHLVRLTGAQKTEEYCKDVPYPYQSTCENPYL